MASNSFFSSDHVFSSEFSQIPPVSVAILESSLMWNQEFILPSFEQTTSNNSMLPLNFGGVSPFPEQLKIPPMIDEPMFSNSNEFEACFSDYSCTDNNSIQRQYQKAVEFLHFQQPEELSAYNDDPLLFNKSYGEHGQHAAGYFGDHKLWEIHHNLQGNNSASPFQTSSGSCSSVEETKARCYSKEERNDRILKYLKKKNQRNFNKTIKYVCRKTLADRRIRVRGRFARNNEFPEELSTTMKSTSNDHQEEDNNHGLYFHNSTPEIKRSIEEEEEEWLHEAVNNLMYLPIFDC